MLSRTHLYNKVNSTYTFTPYLFKKCIEDSRNKAKLSANVMILIKITPSWFQEQSVNTRSEIRSIILNQRKNTLTFSWLKQAFDTIWQYGLRFERHIDGISRKCLHFFINMYKRIKSMLEINSVMLNHIQWHFFTCLLYIK